MRKAEISRLSVLKEVPDAPPKNTKSKAKGTTLNKRANRSAPLLRFQNLVSTVTISQTILNRSLRRRNNAQGGDNGEFEMSHATSPIDGDRRPDTTLTEAFTIRTDVLSRLNMSEQYRYSTKPDRKFQARKVKHIIKEILEERLQDCGEYDATFCQQVSPVIADVIKERVKRLVFPRYKIICHVIMGQMNRQCMRSASRCAWNVEFDDFAQYCHETPTMYAIGVVYGVYAE